MRPWSVPGYLAVVLLLLLTSGQSSRAENDDALRYSRGPVGPSAAPPQRRQRTYYPGRVAPAPGPYGASPYGGSPYGASPYGASPYAYGGVRQPVQPSPYYGRVDPYYDPRRDPRYVAPARPAPERRTARRRPPAIAAPAPAVQAPAPEKKQETKVEITTRVAVFGDSLADLVADGLSEAFEEAAEIEIISEAKADTGLVRRDTQDWAKGVRDFLAANEKITIGLMMVGVNDRQPIREGDQSHDVLGDRWRQLYGERVDAVAAAFSEKRLPFIWIGAPPVRGERPSADLIAINDIVRERVQRVGGVYLDIWPGFVDEENRFAASGPDHRGQTARLRTSDGVHFTRAGARTAAEFAVTEIKRIIDRSRPGAPAAVAGQPAEDPAQRQAAIDRLIDGSVQLPQAGDVAAPLPSRPLAGPVVPLNRPEVAPGGTLIASRPALDPDQSGLNRRALEVGVAPQARPGRADDFRWPR